MAYVITTDYYNNPELNKAARTFPEGRCKVYGLIDPMLRTSAPDISITNDGIGMG